MSKLVSDDIGTGVSKRSRDEPGGCPLIGQAVSGMKVARARSAAFEWNWRRRVRIRPPRRGQGRAVGREVLPVAASEYPLPEALADRLVVAVKVL